MVQTLSRHSRSAWSLLLLLSSALPSGGAADTLATRLDSLIAPVARYASVGVCVRSLDWGDELYARNADEAFVPASNQKLLVAAAALDALGPDFRFTTRVLTIGTRRGDTLRGDLILQGGGDPTLTIEGLAVMADAVAAAGIRRVIGRVRGDDSIFDRQRYGLGWACEDEGTEDAPPISGLALNGNGVTVQVRPAERPGLPPLVRLDPDAAPMTLGVHAMTGPAGVPGTLRITRSPVREEIVVSGRLPLNGSPVSARVTVEEPALYAATVFTVLLRARGIQVTGPPVLLGTPGSAVPLTELPSRPLWEIVVQMNKSSNNLYAEMFLKALGMRSTGNGAGTGIGGEGEAALRRFLSRSGLRGPALALADGSGLSRLNLVSPRNLVQLLSAMDRHPAREPYFNSLPVAGVDGTLRRRMVGTAAAGVVRAKTGTLDHVTALSGVATTRDGERLAFSVLTNNYPGTLSGPGGPREMEDAIAIALAEFRRSGGQAVRPSGARE